VSYFHFFPQDCDTGLSAGFDLQNQPLADQRLTADSSFFPNAATLTIERTL
jgi:hypothetical protein